MNYVKSCDYCHEDVSVFESVTEFGKHYHDACMIHKLQSEIERYKKKYINQKMTDGDKIELVDKYVLVKKLMSERTENKGWKMIAERTRATPKTTEKLMLSDSSGFPILDSTGKPQFVETKTSSCEVRYAIVRPNVTTTTLPLKNLLTTAEEILQIPGEPESKPIKIKPAGALLEVGRNPV